MLSVWWLGITVVGIMVVTSLSNVGLSRARSQWCADAVALAMVSGTRESVRWLLEELDARVVMVRSMADTVTVEVETPWGPATASATRGT